MYGRDMHNFPLPVFEKKTDPTLPVFEEKKCDTPTLPEQRFVVGVGVRFGARARARARVRVRI
jgi:hypothetical protein